jgi:hypothetical protein
MRPALVLVAVLGVVCGYAAEPIVVLGPGRIAGESRTLTPDQAAFVKAVDLAAGPVESLALMAPPEWGRTVAGAVGQVRLHPHTVHGLVLEVSLEGLRPDHRYILTLNGNPQLPGNERLPDPVPGLPAERYFDFFTATTDAHGAYAGKFGITLPAGPYRVRFYVKDTDDFKIVLYHDYFPCGVD